MAYDVRCKLYTEQVERDTFGAPTGEPPLWRVVWCSETYSGGARKTYAGRVVGEHQVVMTTHWREGIEKCRLIEFDGIRRAIVDVVPEGRRHMVHIITYTDDVGYGE
jgi:hypothetical protein